MSGLVKRKFFQRFTVDDTYTVPSGVTIVWIECIGGGGSGGSSFPEGRFSSFTSWSSVSTLRRHPVTTSIITIVIRFFIWEELFYFFKTDMIPICIVTEKKIMGFSRLE